MRGGEGIRSSALETVQPLHRHADARLILFVAGEYAERSFDECGVFGPGDFLVRPGHYAHDGRDAAGDARYLRLRVRAPSLRRFFATYGWRAWRGRCGSDWRERAAHSDDLDASDELLSCSHVRQLDSLQDASPMADVAARLSDPSGATLRALAEWKSIEPWTLSRRFALAFGIGPSRYRQQARLQHAVRMMAETQLSLSAIAAAAGFSDQSHLGRAVRGATGRTADELRREVAIA